jgi:hypothetical protein
LARGIGHLRRRALGAQESVQALAHDVTYRSDREAVAFFYCTANDHYPDLDEPSWINEKIRWQFLNHPNPLISLAADKLEVRDYLRWKGAKIEPPRLLASGSDPAELERVDLPDRFVLKTTFASGQNQIVAEGGEDIPRAMLVEIVQRWMRYDFWRKNGELHYRDIPKRWLVEEYVPATSEKIEYKAVCFHGEPIFFLVITERDYGGARGRAGIRHAFYDPDWRRVDLGVEGIPDDPRPIPRPPELPLLISEARRLSADFMHVRVDFLKFDGRLTFSELTFSSNGARLPYTPAAMNETIGAMMDLARAPAYLELGRRTVRAMQQRLAA